MKTEVVTFGAGCFWGIEDTFSKVRGVVKTRVGYAGGNLKNPTYQKVCSGKTGHVEAVEVTFNPKVISYEKLLEVFWNIHNPTTKGRQGVDIGSQYNSAIFYHNEKQKEIAEKSKKDKQKGIGKKVVTMIKPAKDFWKAEEYHQKYFEKQKKKSFFGKLFR